MANLEGDSERPPAPEASRPTERRAGRFRRRSRGHRPWGLFVGGLLVGAIGVIALLTLLVLPLAVGHRRDLPLERLYGDAAVSLAARFHAGSQQNPLTQNARTLTAGRYAYTGSCAQCHGATGDGKGVFGQATYPNATDLTSHDAKEKSDAELFWITKHGLSFTGMPAFGGQYDDQAIWALVVYLRALQSAQGTPIAVPTASAQQLAAANPVGDAVSRGAAVYYAQGCQTCHGPTGNAPGELALRRGASRDANQAIRNGRSGMPAYGSDRIGDAQMADLIAYLNSLNNSQR